MFQLLKKYRKGVSPVIAIVLLIALTVAAAAVIWTLTSGILDDASGHTLVSTGSASATTPLATTMEVKVTLRANSITDLNGATFKTAPASLVTTPTVSFTSGATLASGDNAVVILFTAGSGEFTAGSYVINLSWSGEGDDPKLLEISFTL